MIRSAEEEAVIGSAYRYRTELIEALNAALGSVIVTLPDGKKVRCTPFRPTKAERYRLIRERKFRTLVNFECEPVVD
jgi:hypothetical protein